MDIWIVQYSISLYGRILIKDKLMCVREYVSKFLIIFYSEACVLWTYDANMLNYSASEAYVF